MVQPKRIGGRERNDLGGGDGHATTAHDLLYCQIWRCDLFNRLIDTLSAELSTRDLFQEAKSYALIAASQLQLDDNPVPAFGFSGGVAGTLAGRYEIYIVHFLFPNLNDGEQDCLLKLNLLNWSIRKRELDGNRDEDGRKKYEQYLNLAKTFEHQLTASQMRLLETNFFNPDVTENDFDPEGLDY